ncbi:MAG: hypothetical protein ACRDZY_06125 [Acidimicrobiales bacterium]
MVIGPAPDRRDGLAILGLRPGEAVRWRPAPTARWKRGSVTRRERDGSIGVVDDGGAARSIPVERLEVRRAGPRQGVGWEALTARAARCEQLSLL